MWCSALGGIITLILSLLVAPLAAEAQPWGKVYRIGILGDGPYPSEAQQQQSPFLQGLRELGWHEGQNLVIERRFVAGDLDRLPDLAAELVRLPVDLLVAGGAAAWAAKHATTTIPIVFIGTANPVARGLVTSLARPGGNITGVAVDVGGADLMAKRLELLKEAVPTISSVAFVWGTERAPAATYDALEKELERRARMAGLTLRFLSARQPEDFTERVFPAIQADLHTIHALSLSGPVSFVYRRQLADFALQHRLPMMGHARAQADAGFLLAYEPSQRAMLQRAAVLVGKILQGAKPADLPVEQPTTFELVINLKTAQALGLTIPPHLLVLADEVIK